MFRQNTKGMTLVEMLIAMSILGFLLLITSCSIIQSLQVNRLAEEASNTQSKMRRITEVISQELRSAVLGSITDWPVSSDANGISFALLSGDGGLQVRQSPGGSWHNSVNTYVYSSDPAARDRLVGHPAVIVPEITGAPGHDHVQHVDCQIPIHYTQNTRLYSAHVIGYSFDPDLGTLFEVTQGGEAEQTVPFACALSNFEIANEYDEGNNNELVVSLHFTDGGVAQPQYEQGGETYELARLRITLASDEDDGGVAREYVSYIELTGIGNDVELPRAITQLVPCGTTGGGPGTPPDDEEPGGPGTPPDDEEPGGPGGPGGPGTPPEDPPDDDEPGCGKWRC